jgi:hypothetical protein
MRLTWRSAGSRVVVAVGIGVILMSGVVAEGWPRLRSYVLRPDRIILVPSPWADRPPVELPIPPDSVVMDRGRRVLALYDQPKLGWRAGEVAEIVTWLEVPATPSEVSPFIVTRC